MVNVKVGQTIRVNIAVWDFCGELGNNALNIHGVGIDTMPALDPEVICQDITGLAIEFRLVTAGDVLCKGCNPEVVYSTWGTAYTDSRGSRIRTSLSIHLSRNPFALVYLLLLLLSLGRILPRSSLMKL